MVVKFQNYYKAILETQGIEEWPDAFNSENIPSTLLSNSYHLSYSIDSVSSDANYGIENEIDTEIKIFKKGYRNSRESLDLAMSEAIELRQLFMSPKSLATFTEANIIGITSVSIIPEQLQDNDNSIIVTLSFSTRVYESIC